MSSVKPLTSLAIQSFTMDDIAKFYQPDTQNYARIFEQALFKLFNYNVGKKTYTQIQGTETTRSFQAIEQELLENLGIIQEITNSIQSFPPEPLPPESLLPPSIILNVKTIISDCYKAKTYLDNMSYITFSFTILKNLQGNENASLEAIIYDSNTSLNEKVKKIKEWFNDETNQNALHQIIELDLTERNLTIIPEEINKFTNLQRLFFYDNKITTIPNLNLPQLQSISIFNNKIETIPSDLNLPQLQKLYLYGNPLNVDQISHSNPTIQNAIEY